MIDVFHYSMDDMQLNCMGALSDYITSSIKTFSQLPAILTILWALLYIPKNVHML